MRLDSLADLLATCAVDDDIDLAELEAQMRAHRQADADHQARTAIVHKAYERAQRNLDDAITTHADTIIREHLAPAIASTIADLRTAAATYRHHGNSDREMLNAPKPAREAWLTSDHLVTAYTVLRATRTHLLRAVGASAGNDARGLFGEVRNTEEVWPAIVSPAGVFYTGQPAPWDHPDPRTRLVNLLDLGAELWCPTHAEQEARWAEVFGDRLKQIDPHAHLALEARAALNAGAA